jgi:hypothetical protein
MVGEENSGRERESDMTITIILAVGTFVAVAGLSLLAIWALGEEGRNEDKWVKEYMARNRAEGESRWQETGGDEWMARVKAVLANRAEVKAAGPLEFDPADLDSIG